MKKFVLVLLSLFMFTNLSFAQENPVLKRSILSIDTEIGNMYRYSYYDRIFLKIAEEEAKNGKYSDYDVLRGLVKLRKIEIFNYTPVQIKNLKNEASHHFKEALSKNNFATVHENANCYYHLVQFLTDDKTKLSYLDNAINLENKAPYYTERAYVKLKLNDVNGALTDAKIAENYNANQEIKNIFKGVLKDSSASEAVIKEGQKISTVLGMIYEALNDHKLAINYYTSVVDRNSTYRMAPGSTVGFKNTYRVYHIKKDNVYAGTRLGLLYLKENRYQDAQELLEALTQFYAPQERYYLQAKQVSDYKTETQAVLYFMPSENIPTKDYHTLKNELGKIYK